MKKNNFVKPSGEGRLISVDLTAVAQYKNKVCPCNV